MSIYYFEKTNTFLFTFNKQLVKNLSFFINLLSTNTSSYFTDNGLTEQVKKEHTAWKEIFQ